MGIHHKMIINIPIVIILMLPILISLNEEFDGIRKKSLKIICIGVMLIQIVNFARAFSWVQVRNDSLHIWSDKYYPQIRNDIEALYELADTLNALTAENDARESGYMEEDLQAMRDYFDSIYPDYHELFSDRIYL